MSGPGQISLLPFRLDDRRFGLPVAMVERTLQAVEVTPLPNAPAVVLGMINHWGRVVPVYDLRRRLLLPQAPVRIGDHLVLVRTARRLVGMQVDTVEVVTAVASTSFSAADAIIPGLEHLQGVCALEDGLLYIHDPESFLSPEEAKALDLALELGA